VDGRRRFCGRRGMEVGNVPGDAGDKVRLEWKEELFWLERLPRRVTRWASITSQ
jgi:hypothetical protein